MVKTIVGIYFSAWEWCEYIEEDDGLSYGGALDKALLELGFHTDEDKSLIKEIHIWKGEVDGK